MLPVHLVDEIKLHSLRASAEPLIANVLYLRLRRRNAGVADRRSLAVRGQERSSPVVHASVGKRWADRDKGGQILILRSQSVNHPRPHARPNELIGARVELQQGAAMRRVRTVNGTQNAKVVNVLCDVGKQLAYRQAALTVLMKLPGRLQQVALLAERDSRKIKRQRFAVVPIQQRLGVERVDMGRSSLHEQKDHTLGSRSEVRRLGRQWTRGFAGDRLTGLGAEHRGEGEISESDRVRLQHRAPIGQHASHSLTSNR